MIYRQKAISNASVFASSNSSGTSFKRWRGNSSVTFLYHMPPHALRPAVTRRARVERHRSAPGRSRFGCDTILNNLHPIGLHPKAHPRRGPQRPLPIHRGLLQFLPPVSAWATSAQLSLRYGGLTASTFSRGRSPQHTPALERVCITILAWAVPSAVDIPAAASIMKSRIMECSDAYLRLGPASATWVHSVPSYSQ